jgi:hypothetical protein
MKLISRLLELIEVKFPWYLRMHDLMGTSPVVDRAAITHSQTPVDLSTLGRNSQSFAPSTGDDSISIDWPSSRPSSPVPCDNEDDDKNSTALSSPPSSPSKPQPLTTPTPKAKVEYPTSIPRTNKRKAIADRVQEIADMDRSQRMKIAEVKEREKTSRSQAKYQSKHALEMARMEFQRREAEYARQHQLQMLEKQVELERLKLQVHGHGHTHLSHVVPPPTPGPSSSGMFNFNPSPSGPIFGIDPVFN